MRTGEEWDVEVVSLPHAEGLPMPSYGSEGAAAIDLIAAVEDDVWIAPHGTVVVPTGRRIALPKGHTLLIHSRSGMATNRGLVVAQGVGIIDEDYRGEVFVPLRNTSDANAQRVVRGERIAQAILVPVMRMRWVGVDALPDTARGAGGFGSTGV